MSQHLLNDATTRMPRLEEVEETEKHRRFVKLKAMTGKDTCFARKAFALHDAHLDPVLTFVGAPEDSVIHQSTHSNESKLAHNSRRASRRNLVGSRDQDQRNIHEHDVTSIKNPHDGLMRQEIQVWDRRFRLAFDKFGFTDDHERASMTWRAAAISTFHLNQLYYEHFDYDTVQPCQDGNSVYSKSILCISKETMFTELKQWFDDSDCFEDDFNDAWKQEVGAVSEDQIEWVQFLRIWRCLEVDRDVEGQWKTYDPCSDNMDIDDIHGLLKRHFKPHSSVRDKDWLQHLSERITKKTNKWVAERTQQLLQLNQLQDSAKAKQIAENRLMRQVGNLDHRIKSSLAIDNFFRMIQRRSVKTLLGAMCAADDDIVAREEMMDVVAETYGYHVAHGSTTRCRRCCSSSTKSKFDEVWETWEKENRLKNGRLTRSDADSFLDELEEYELLNFYAELDSISSTDMEDEIKDDEMFQQGLGVFIGHHHANGSWRVEQKNRLQENMKRAEHEIFFRSSRHKWNWNIHLHRAICGVFIFCYMPITQTAMDMLIPRWFDKKMYLMADMSTVFFSTGHIVYFALALLYAFLFCFWIPLYIHRCANIPVLVQHLRLGSP
eukprot:SAG31_NODE_439_length_15675_cov_6.578390_13_plen_607_part_00